MLTKEKCQSGYRIYVICNVLEYDIGQFSSSTPLIGRSPSVFDDTSVLVSNGAS